MTYNKDAVTRAIKQDKRIKKAEAKTIHRLLAGWRSTRTPRLGPLQRAADGAIQRENRRQAAGEKARRAAELRRLGISVEDETTHAS